MTSAPSGPAWSRGGVHQYYVYGSQRHVPDLIYEDTDGDVEIDNVYRVLTDERGSVRMVVSLAATPIIAQRIEYDVFGNPTFPVGGETVQPFGFAGAIWMPHARFWHMGARDYDPAVGRWTSKDPIRFAGGTNLYVYCEGDPVNRLDPDGLFVVGLGGFGGAAVVSGGWINFGVYFDITSEGVDVGAFASLSGSAGVSFGWGKGPQLTVCPGGMSDFEGASQGLGGGFAAGERGVNIEVTLPSEANPPGEIYYDRQNWTPTISVAYQEGGEFDAHVTWASRTVASDPFLSIRWRDLLP
jgi:RHS repeat-associated protein